MIIRARCPSKTITVYVLVYGMCHCLALKQICDTAVQHPYSTNICVICNTHSTQFVICSHCNFTCTPGTMSVAATRWGRIIIITIVVPTNIFFLKLFIELFVILWYTILKIIILTTIWLLINILSIILHSFL